MMWHTIKSISDNLGVSRQWVWKTIKDDKEIMNHPGVQRKKPLSCNGEVAELIKSAVIARKGKGRGPARKESR